MWLRAAWCSWLPLVLLVVGAEMRVRQFLGNRSLWLDESLIARDIAGTSFAGLTRPLRNNQGAPLLWLWSERGVTRLLGGGEQAFRLVPLLAGLLVLVLIWILARELLPAAAVPVAVGVVVLNPALLDYSTEVKQYESDVAVFLALALIATRLPRAQPGTSRRRWLAAWALASALAVVGLPSRRLRLRRRRRCHRGGADPRSRVAGARRLRGRDPRLGSELRARL